MTILFPAMVVVATMIAIVVSTHGVVALIMIIVVRSSIVISRRLSARRVIRLVSRTIVSSVSLASRRSALAVRLGKFHLQDLSLKIGAVHFAQSILSSFAGFECLLESVKMRRRRARRSIEEGEMGENRDVESETMYIPQMRILQVYERSKRFQSPRTWRKRPLLPLVVSPRPDRRRKASYPLPVPKKIGAVSR